MLNSSRLFASFTCIHSPSVIIEFQSFMQKHIHIHTQSSIVYDSLPHFLLGNKAPLINLSSVVITHNALDQSTHLRYWSYVVLVKIGKEPGGPFLVQPRHLLPAINKHTTNKQQTNEWRHKHKRTRTTIHALPTIICSIKQRWTYSTTSWIHFSYLFLFYNRPLPHTTTPIT